MRGAGLPSDTKVGALVQYPDFILLREKADLYRLTRSVWPGQSCLSPGATITSAPSLFSSVVTGVDGLPLAFAFTGASNAKAIHCSNVFCVPYARNR